MGEQNNLYSMTYVEFSSASRGTLPFFSMRNKANHVVTPSTTSVQSAMTDYASIIQTGNAPASRILFIHMRCSEIHGVDR